MLPQEVFCTLTEKATQQPAIVRWQWTPSVTTNRSTFVSWYVQLVQNISHWNNKEATACLPCEFNSYMLSSWLLMWSPWIFWPCRAEILCPINEICQCQWFTESMVSTFRKTVCLMCLVMQGTMWLPHSIIRFRRSVWQSVKQQLSCMIILMTLSWDTWLPYTLLRLINVIIQPSGYINLSILSPHCEYTSLLACHLINLVDSGQKKGSVPVECFFNPEIVGDPGMCVFVWLHVLYFTCRYFCTCHNVFDTYLYHWRVVRWIGKLSSQHHKKRLLCIGNLRGCGLHTPRVWEN